MKYTIIIRTLFDQGDGLKEMHEIQERKSWLEVITAMITIAIDGRLPFDVQIIQKITS